MTRRLATVSKIPISAAILFSLLPSTSATDGLLFNHPRVVTGGSATLREGSVEMIAADGGAAPTLLVTFWTARPTADSILIGAPVTGGNARPFNTLSNLTRYQQVYDASSFGELFEIAGVTFFNTFSLPATFTEADYAVSLSTTSRSVNALDTTDLQNNVGSDNTLIFVGHLSGPTGASFTLGGLATFLYNPALGNLLMDIQISNVGLLSGSSLDARNGDAGGLFSRAEQFGTFIFASDNFGLVTQFEGPVDPIDPVEEIQEILDFLDQSVTGGSLAGSGPGGSAAGRLNALRNMLLAASDLLQQGNTEEACGQLRQAYLRTDGDPRPPDFVIGPAAETLARMIVDLMASLGCPLG